jgi:hypothetical protein
MKAITICQPYAGAIMDGRKRVENRGWRTNYRGQLIIHAGKSLQWMKTWDDETDGPLPKEMHLGAVVGIAELTAVYIKTDIVTQLLSSKCTHPHRWVAYHHHASGPFLWVLENVKRLVTPIECNGKQGLWNPQELILSDAWKSAEFEDVEPEQDVVL